MKKKQRNFRISSDLDSLLKTVAEKEGLTVSQLIELACYHLLDFKNIENNQSLEDKSDRNKRLSVYLRTDNKTYEELTRIVKEKNTTYSQEINYRLKATIFDNSFSKIEMKGLFQAMYDLNRLGNLLKLSLNNELNTPELLNEIALKIEPLWDHLKDITTDVSKRKIR